MNITVAMENFVPLNQQQRESKAVIVAEIGRLRRALELAMSRRIIVNYCMSGTKESGWAYRYKHGDWSAKVYPSPVAAVLAAEAEKEK